MNLKYTLDGKVYDIYFVSVDNNPLLSVSHFNYNGEIQTKTLRLKDIIEQLIRELEN
jgi:hypothetical protein